MGFFVKPQGEFPSQVIGVDVGHAHLLVLAVEKKLGKAVISHFHLEPRPPTPEEVSGRLQEIFREEGLSLKGVRAVLKSEGMVIRVLTFPQMKKSELASVFSYEVEKYIPFKASEVILDFQVLSENAPDGGVKTMEVLLVAVKQKEIYHLLGIFQRAGLEVEILDVGAFAFANLLEFLFPQSKSESLAFLDMGVESSTFGIVRRGKPIFIRDLSFGGDDILKLLRGKLALARDAAWAPQRDPSLFTPEYKAVVEQALSGLFNELRLSLGYYWDQVPGAEPIQNFYVAGGGFRFVQDLSALERETKIHTSRPAIFSRIEVPPHLDPSLLRENEDLLPPALGLCLR